MKLNSFSNYEIYPETGKVWSYKSNRYIGCIDKNTGYWYVTLFDDKNNKYIWRLHRLIWYVVNGTIPNDMQVNHIDENKSNNSISNLNILSAKDNSNWGTRNNRIKLKTTNGKCSKGVIGLRNNDIVVLFPSMMEAERNGYSAGNICNCCNGKLEYYKNIKWQYIDDWLADWWEQEMEKVA